jgi:hypothetical protein
MTNSSKYQNDVLSRLLLLGILTNWSLIPTIHLLKKAALNLGMCIAPDTWWNKIVYTKFSAHDAFLE